MQRELEEHIFDLINAAGNNQGELTDKEKQIAEEEYAEKLAGAEMFMHILSLPHILRAIASKDANHSSIPLFELGSWNRDDANHAEVNLSLKISLVGRGQELEIPEYEIVEAISLGRISKENIQAREEAINAFPEYASRVKTEREDEYSESLYAIRYLSAMDLASGHGSHLDEIAKSVKDILTRK